MISNIEVPSVVLPCSKRTYVQNRSNWLYNLNEDNEAGQVPLDIPENVNAEGDTNEDYDQGEQGSPVHEPPPHHSPHISVSLAHTTPYFSDTFAGTSIGAAHITLDDVLCKMHTRNASSVKRGSLISAMHHQQTNMMQNMH